MMMMMVDSYMLCHYVESSEKMAISPEPPPLTRYFPEGEKANE